MWERLVTFFKRFGSADTSNEEAAQMRRDAEANHIADHNDDTTPSQVRLRQREIERRLRILEFEAELKTHRQH